MHAREFQRAFSAGLSDPKQHLVSAKPARCSTLCGRTITVHRFAQKLSRLADFYHNDADQEAPQKVGHRTGKSRERKLLRLRYQICVAGVQRSEFMPI